MEVEGVGAGVGIAADDGVERAFEHAFSAKQSELATIHDHDFTTQVREMLENDIKDSRIVSPEEAGNRSFWSRFASRASRLMAPVQ